MTRMILLACAASLALTACAAPRAARTAVKASTTAVKTSAGATKLAVKGVRAVTRTQRGKDCAEDTPPRNCKAD